jgi:adenylate kinase
MGMPGVGKGTQASRLAKSTGALHVSTGDMLRDAIQAGTSLGRKVKQYLDSGRLVPDDLVGEVIAERLARRDAAEGFILDGFPRTTEQVEILDRVLGQLDARLDGVFLLVAPEDEIVRRLSGRRVCPACGALYHVESEAPKSAGVCDRCGSALVQRSDDTEAVIRERLQVFKDQTLPIADIYRERDQLHEIDGSGDPETVFRLLRKALERT